MKKKITLTLLGLVCTLCCAFGLSACDFGGGKNNEPQQLEFTLNDDGESYAVAMNKNFIPKAAADIVIPETYKNKPVTRIVEGAFAVNFSYSADFPLTITIPESVTVIEKGAFSGCDTLTRVNIPGKVTSIEEHTFSGCARLTSITIPDSITSIGDNAFLECRALETVTIGNSVESIGFAAFHRCGLTCVDIPDSVKSIAAGAFSFCSNLKNLKIGSGVENIDDDSNSGFGGVFTMCPIETAEVPAFACIPTILGHNEHLKSVVITSGSEIPQYAFNSSPLLTSVTIPDGITKINNYTFSNCPSLKSIKIPDSVTSIYENSFENTVIETAELPATACTSPIVYNNTHLKTAVITSGNEIIANSFSGCTNLTSITIPSTVTKISANTFYRCDKLEYINYVGSLENWCRIGGLSNLMKSPRRELTVGGKKIEGTFVIPETITDICDYAFAYCYDITNVVISKYTTSISANAFSNCSINRVFFKGTKSEWNGMYIDGSVHGTYLFYSKEKPQLNPDGTDYIDRYWHYDTDGVTPVIWSE